ncbi:MAG: hypothetical protein K2I96_09480 [Lachnospiraceae bacterium]|nr:hypothetical protein [Lachnospiraceae bacterium]
MQLFFEGTDIYKKVSVNTCIYDSYGEQQSDTLRIVFNDGNDLWDSWKPQKGNRISVILGACDTGEMYITSVSPENGKMCIRASSVPQNYNDKSCKSWQNVHFKQLCEEIAERHSISCEFYAVTDQVYEYVNQQNKEDFVFLSERCILEGCSFLVYDNKMIVYSEQGIESVSADVTLKIQNDKHFEYKDESNDIYSSCILKNGKLSGSYTVAGVPEKVLTKVISVKMSSQAEADRYAKNMLRYENKKMSSGAVSYDLFLGAYAAGSVVNLETPSVSSWNVPVFLTHVRHDMVRARTKLFFRKTLEGY